MTVILSFVLEALVGYPQAIMRVLSHPVVWMGKALGWMEQRLNRPEYSFRRRRLQGVVALLVLLALSLFVAWIILQFGKIVEVIAMASLFSTRSLYEHVRAISVPLGNGDMEKARHALSHIVGRDVDALDESGIATAAIESLAESSCDGVVAPLFWAMIGGLPGLVIFKAVSTADSMIGHKDERYYAFGWAGARADDVMNWLPARITAFLIALSSAKFFPVLQAAQREGVLHASSNAGWPEAAMARALGVRLGGSRAYGGKTLQMPCFNAEASLPQTEDLRRGLALFSRMVCVLLLSAFLLTVLFPAA